MKTHMRCKLLVSCCSPTAFSLTPLPWDNAIAVPPAQKAARLRRCTALAFARVRGLTTLKPDRLGGHMVAGRITRLDRHNRRGGRSGLSRLPDVGGTHRCKTGGASRLWLLHPVRRVEHRPGNHGWGQRLGLTSSRSRRRAAAGARATTCCVVPAEARATLRSLRGCCSPDAAIAGLRAIWTEPSFRCGRLHTLGHQKNFGEL